MLRSYLLWLLALFCLQGCFRQNIPKFDIVIVGGGLAGLSASTRLAKYRVLILEKGDRIGGRVSTKNLNGTNIDTGALFAFDPKILDFPIKTSEYVSGETEMALRYNNRTLVCRHARDCIEQSGLSRPDLTNALAWLNSADLPVTALRPEPYMILNAFFGAIHAGELNEYASPERQRTFTKIPNGHFEAGNGSLVNALIQKTTAQIQLGAEVTRVSDEGSWVEVTYRDKQGVAVVQARQVICTTDAVTAHNLLTRMLPASKSFLASIVYRGGVTVTLGLEKDPLSGIGYIVQPGENPHVFFKSLRGPKRVAVLTGYWKMPSKSDLKIPGARNLVEATLKSLKNYGIHITPKEILFSDMQPWEKIEPIMSETVLSHWSPAALQPSPNVVLAGDYTYVVPPHPLPYGISPAVNSGYLAAEKVLLRLQGKEASQ